LLRSAEFGRGFSAVFLDIEYSERAVVISVHFCVAVGYGGVGSFLKRGMIGWVLSRYF
jgi:hypothetical protein